MDSIFNTKDIHAILVMSGDIDIDSVGIYENHIHHAHNSLMIKSLTTNIPIFFITIPPEQIALTLKSSHLTIFAGGSIQS